MICFRQRMGNGIRCRLTFWILTFCLRSSFVNTLPHVSIENGEWYEVRLYPAGPQQIRRQKTKEMHLGTWVSVPVPNDDYGLMMAYGFDVRESVLAFEKV